MFNFLTEKQKSGAIKYLMYIKGIINIFLSIQIVEFHDSGMMTIFLSLRDVKLEKKRIKDFFLVMPWF